MKKDATLREALDIFIFVVLILEEPKDLHAEIVYFCFPSNLCLKFIRI